MAEERISSAGKTIGILEKDGLSIEVLTGLSYKSSLDIRFIVGGGNFDEC